jgi:periplasmic divalent cation tolerance protein
MSSKYIEIHWTSGSIDEARRISRFLVQERLVASVQIIPWIESIYMWNNQLETTQESKIMLKAPAENYSKIEKIILDNSTYQVPEIIFYSIEGGSASYLDWLSECTPEMQADTKI